MNVLAHELEQLDDKTLANLEVDTKSQEFVNHYFWLRYQEEDKWYSTLTLKQRQKIHKLILMCYKLNNRLGGFSYEVLHDFRSETDRPIIYVCTHIGKFDIEVVSEAIKDHFYLLSGDYEHLQGLFCNRFLRLNGVFFFNERIKEDRRKVTRDMISHLRQDGNLLYFIEGTWNIKPNLPVLPCYWGIVDVAKKGNAIIVPIGVEQYDKHFKINIGSNFDMNTYGNSIEDKYKAIGDLRDTLATLKYEIWETEKHNRSSIKEDEWNQYVQERLAEWPGFSEEYIDSLIYRPKDVVTNDEAFVHLRKLQPKAANAFLWNKRLK